MTPSNSISDAKYNFLPEEHGFRAALRSVILKAGRKKVIFVEGYDDQVIFNKKIFPEYSEKLFFLDVSLEQPKRTSHPNVRAIGGCEQVKSLLIDFVTFLPQDDRFYGVIDRDLKTDQEVEAESNKACYDGRLFVFFERYTLENYFIRIDILKAFIHGQSIKHKELIPLVDDDAKLEEIMADIISCLAEIAAANLTIRFFDKTKDFVYDTVGCAEIEIENDVLRKSSQFPEDLVSNQFQSFKDFIMQSYPDNVQKFASAKKYFATQFNRRLEADYTVNLQINNHKDLLAEILKNHPPLPADFNNLLEFMGVQPS